MPCGFLHSHQDLYPAGVGARQQMVTSYMHRCRRTTIIITIFPLRDENNLFTVRRNGSTEAGGTVRSGELVVLEHWATGRNLHSHRIPSVMAKSHFQVTGYGEDGLGDDNDVWRVEVAGAAGGAAVRPLVDQVRLRHLHLGCLLTCTSELLPKEWGYGQMEVSCSPWLRQTTEARGFAHSLWTIEASLEGEGGQGRRPVEEIAPGSWGKFLEAHRMMLYVNKRMGTSGTRDEMTAQAPWMWPLNFCAQRFSGMRTEENRMMVTLLGSPAVWWTNLACLLLCPALLLSSLFSSRRAGEEEEEVRSSPHLAAAATLLGAWAVHYLPFFFMFRVLYVHHYYPALYFSSLLSSVLLDHLLRRATSRLPHQLRPVATLSFLVAVFAVLAYTFHLFAPITYGHSEEEAKHANSTLHHLHWLDRWDL